MKITWNIFLCLLEALKPFGSDDMYIDSYNFGSRNFLVRVDTFVNAGNVEELVDELRELNHICYRLNEMQIDAECTKDAMSRKEFKQTTRQIVEAIKNDDFNMVQEIISW